MCTLIGSLVPSAPYPAASLFGQRLIQSQAEKQHVAEAVADRFFAAGVAAFISDGTGAFYVGLKLMRMAQDYAATANYQSIALRTNSLALGDELVFGATAIPNLQLETARGTVDARLFATYGVHSARFAEHFAQESICSVISVSAIFAAEGPYGADQNTLEVKRAVMRTPFHKLIIVADHTKLARVPCKDAGFPAFDPPAEPWHRLLAQENVFLFTTRFPGAPPAAPNKPLNALKPEERYARQATLLRMEMGPRFVECPGC
jgi:DeoR/GlpR family transcriptional regulator of sugar metabolism